MRKIGRNKLGKLWTFLFLKLRSGEMFYFCAFFAILCWGNRFYAYIQALGEITLLAFGGLLITRRADNVFLCLSCVFFEFVPGWFFLWGPNGRVKILKHISLVLSHLTQGENILGRDRDGLQGVKPWKPWILLISIGMFPIFPLYKPLTLRYFWQHTCETSFGVEPSSSSADWKLPSQSFAAYML